MLFEHSYCISILPVENKIKIKLTCIYISILTCKTEVFFTFYFFVDFIEFWHLSFQSFKNLHLINYLFNFFYLVIFLKITPDASTHCHASSILKPLAYFFLQFSAWLLPLSHCLLSLAHTKTLRIIDGTLCHHNPFLLPPLLYRPEDHQIRRPQIISIVSSKSSARFESHSWTAPTSALIVRR